MLGLDRTVKLVLPALALLAAAAPLAAQGPIADFAPVDYVVRVDGQEVAADVWQSRLSGEMVILGSDGALDEPVRLVLREARAETIGLMKIDRRADGELTVLPNASERQLGTFTVSSDGQGVTFSLDGRRVEVRQKPPLLGERQLADMKEYSRDYVRRAAEYRPSRPFIERLREEDRPVRVEVFFGSWCSACQRWVPRIMRVADELAGSNIAVDFYGLPQGSAFDREPRVREMEIKSVPTAVVYVDGRESGRITAEGWNIPELSLNSILVKR